MHPHDNPEALLRVLREPRRNRYFYGKRMDVQHFQMEQDYGKHKQWLLNRLTLGKGVLCGLGVRAGEGRLWVDPGVAIDGLGREIIVPMRYCVDAVVAEDTCCGAHRQPPTTDPKRETGATRDGLFTLWLCYRECMTDQQPVLVSECGTRDECAAGTLVETFCLKFLPGMAPPLPDPQWCPTLWKAHEAEAAIEAEDAAGQDALKAARESRRHALCGLFDEDCTALDGDPCVPLALVRVKGDTLAVESCVVRPRIYSNQRLLDLILCLADKIDACCGEQLSPLQVRSIEFVRRTADGAETPVGAVLTPLQETAVDINGRTNAIRLRFTRALATDHHRPTTHGPDDPDFELHNLQVLAQDPLDGLAYVPGSLQLEAPDTVRFDLARGSPYSRGANGWQKGRYTILLRGDEQLAQNRQALADSEGQPLDGEPRAPAAGAMSGSGLPGGDFKAAFVVGAAPAPEPSPSPSPSPTPTPAPTPAPTQPPRELMHVRKIDFLGFGRAGVDRVIGTVKDPREPTEVHDHIRAIRFVFDHPYAPSGAHQPAAAGRDDPDFEAHNVQLRLAEDAAQRFGTKFVGGKLVQEDAQTFRIDIEPGTRLVNADGRWLQDRKIACEIFLRGDPDAARNAPELRDAADQPLDGERKPRSGGVISGDAAAGGDFIAPFVVLVNG